jgi:5-hydroxyisourate hydrolase
MAGLSIHVVDVSRGLVAAGMRVELHAISESGERALLAHGAIGGSGLFNEPELTGIFKPGAYAALFHVGEFYREVGVALPAVPFLNVVHFHFGITDPAQHCHLPFKCTPWGYSCFRGGA